MLNLINLAKYTGYRDCLDHFTISFDMVTRRISVNDYGDFSLENFNDVLVYEYNENDTHLYVIDVLCGFKNYQHTCSDIITRFNTNKPTQELWDSVCISIIKSLKVYYGMSFNTFVSNHMLTSLVYTTDDSFSVVGDFIDYPITIKDDYNRICEVADSVFDDLQETYVVLFNRDDVLEEITDEYKKMYLEINGTEVPKEFFQ